MAKMTEEETRQALEAYRRYWMSVCIGCLGWSEQDAAEYAAGMVKGRLPVVLHEKAGFWLAKWFIPPAASQLVNEDRARLCTEIVEVIDPGDSDSDFRTSHSPAECAILLARVNEVLRKYGLLEGES